MVKSRAEDRRVVRLVCVAKGDTSDKFPLTFEVTLHERSIAKGRAYFGFQGTLSGELYPFVLYPDGRLDYGSGYDDDADRYNAINILDKTIEPGAIFTTRERDPETDRPREYVLFHKTNCDGVRPSPPERGWWSPPRIGEPDKVKPGCASMITLLVIDPLAGSSGSNQLYEVADSASRFLE